MNTPKSVSKWVNRTASSIVEKLCKDQMKQLGESLSTLKLGEDIAVALNQGIQEGRKLERAEVNGKTSDGYHTFDELYDHRCLLWINLCLGSPEKCYLVKEHYEGWFLLGMETVDGQVSYHCPNKYLSYVEHITERHPEFDGHNSEIVIERLKRLAIQPRNEGSEKK